jgi:hypothetical protein
VTSPAFPVPAKESAVMTAIPFIPPFIDSGPST